MKIGEIRDLLQAAEDQMLPDFIARFESDERSGVQQLVQRAQKRLDALEKERERLMAMHRQSAGSMRRAEVLLQVLLWLQRLFYRRIVRSCT